MPLAGLCNTAQRGTIPTPDSSYDWWSFGEHVTRSAELRLTKLQEQAAQIQARIQKERGKLKAADRKKDTRRKIIAGALALEHAAQDPEWHATLHKLLSRYVEREEDRALFDLNG